MNGRLNGWKEIAAYLGRTVRTAQRWEKDLELPVRRVQVKTGEMIFAEVAEIEQWMRSRSNGGIATVEKAPEAPRAGARWWLVTAACLLLIASTAAIVPRVMQARTAQPFYSKVEDNRLMVLDNNRNVLWQQSFPFRLFEAQYVDYSFPQFPPVRIEDLDGDGHREVLMLVVPGGTNREQPEFRCYNPNGNLRFALDSKAGPARFGDKEYGFPMQPRLFEVSREAKGATIWLVRAHQPEYPSVLQKLDAQGRVLAEYWSNGHISAVKEILYRGRRAILVGGISNEHMGGSGTLAVLDYDHPSGSAPALNHKYKCQDCPSGQPLAYFVFPRLEITEATATQSEVRDLHLRPDGAITVGVKEGYAHMPGGRNVYFPTFYTFSPTLEPIGAELSSEFASNTRMAAHAGLLSREITHSPERDLFPILQWDGEEFVERRPAR